MTTSALPPYEFPVMEVPNITPFTYRDGVTMLEKVKGIIRYINLVVVPYVNTSTSGLGQEFENQVNILIQQVNDALTAQSADVDQKITDLTTYVDNAVNSIINNSVEVQDPLMKAILQNLSSESRTYLDTVYETKGAFSDAHVAALVVSGTATYTALDGVFAKDTDVTETNNSVTTLAGTVADLTTEVDGIPAATDTKITASERKTDMRHAVATGAMPVFTRANGGAPILVQSSQTFASGTPAPANARDLYWPWVIDAKKLIGPGALDNYYLYVSSDHAPADGTDGIWLFTGPTPLGPWLGRGRVYHDTRAGTAQTETPSVVADPTGQYKLLMYYQQTSVPGAVGVQSTCVAYSNDGIAWTLIGTSHDIPIVWPSDGHTGYQTVQTLDGRLISRGLAGGGNFPTFVMWESYDGGRTFALDYDLLAYQSDLAGKDRKVEWNHCYAINWQGARYIIGFLSTFVSGTSVRDGRLFIAPASADYKHIIAPPTIILYPTQDVENTNYRAVHLFQDSDGELYFYYNVNARIYCATTKAGV